MARDSEACGGNVVVSLQADMNSDLAQTCAYLLKCANRFFRILRAEGIFMSNGARQQALQAGLEMNEACHKSKPRATHSMDWRAEEAYAQIAAMSFRAGHKLFRLRPKFHLGIHLAESLETLSALNPRCPLITLPSFPDAF